MCYSSMRRRADGAHDGQAEAGDDAAAAIARYLSLQSCLQGMGLVLRRALGVTMAPVSFRPGAGLGLGRSSA